MPTSRRPKSYIPRDFCIILVTCQSKIEARKIASSLLKKRLAACVNIMPGVDSRFWWKGNIDRSGEVLLTAKSVRRNFMRIEKAVRRLHSYDVPEIIAIPLIAGSADYLRWIACNVE
ncbi:MAG: divalent-cation tolerance protein CutA [Candidatus Omnitrophota bacterium]